MLLLIFVHVGQINTSTVPRNIAMVKVNMSGYGDALETFILNPVFGLYTDNASAPLQQQAGVREIYEFGLYSYCAYVDDTHGTCSNHTTGQRYTPYDVITADMTSNYSILTGPFIPETTFRDSKYLGESSRAAYWMLLLGTICAALALITGIAKNNWTFFVSAIFSIAGSLLLLIGAAIWTVIIKKSQSINNILLRLPNSNTTVGLGITVSEGNGLFIAWAAFVCLFLSIIPYMLSCCTYRG
ncbi:hypothetical protein NLJ89_g7069 [Agrocybe chaxingu]|uniref:Uncharacterized protein n=1 Tax=Agrocybe chaxingu TaxID=84603 RepID=A0A9W8K578_9AGAR|nr:hypothetical protein NLJ89_g7069 [Agrocybe chaxingu]